MVWEPWLIWTAMAAVFVVGEILTFGFFLLWFGVGAGLAAILAYAGFSSSIQWISFIVSSSILFLFSRKFADKFTKTQPPGIGADRFIGKVGVVIQEINNIENTGEVRVEKDKWRANSETDEPIPEGKKVEVIRMDGTHLVVKVVE